MQKNIKRFYLAASLLVSVVFIFLIAQLLQTGSVEFTDENVITTPVIKRSDPVIGSTAPSVVIVYFGNFTCRNCVDFSKNLMNMIETYPDALTVVWKDFPNVDLNPESYHAAIAARCADKQDAFWPYHDLLMANQQILQDEAYIAIATDLGLKEPSFERCLRKESPTKLIEESNTEAETLGLLAAPALFINGERHVGAMDARTLENLILDIINTDL